VGTITLDRARDQVADLANRGWDVVMFARAANEVVAKALPVPFPPCWSLVDPASLLITGSFDGQGGGMSHQMLVEEYLEDDGVKVRDLVRAKQAVLTAADFGADDADDNPFMRDLREMGLDDGAAIAVRTPAGQAWGSVVIARHGGRFDRKEVDFLRAISPHLARGVRQGLLVGEAADPEGPDAPGLVVLDEDWTISSASPGVQLWLAELPGYGGSDRPLPPSVVSVAASALRAAQGNGAAAEAVFARVLSETGRWVLLHGVALVADGARRSAVIVEPAHPARITPLLMAAYGLTPREQDVTRRVLSGDSTAEIAAALFVSAHTVQQHLKNIFDKAGVHSRRELVGKVFFGHYEPRVRDNEQRVAADRPIRGGPYPYRPDPT
jgi:DNA-binding CsgD family transcriptional regulator